MKIGKLEFEAIWKKRGEFFKKDSKPNLTLTIHPSLWREIEIYVNSQQNMIQYRFELEKLSIFGIPVVLNSQIEGSIMTNENR